MNGGWMVRGSVREGRGLRGDGGRLLVAVLWSVKSEDGKKDNVAEGI